MASIPKKCLERYSKNLSKYQKVLENAQKRDLNESDTVTIIQDILSEVFGYDKYLEITSEFAIRNTYCDLAIKIGEKIQYLIEVKAIGTQLKDEHLKQAVDYGANHGAQWVVLTNGIQWDLYKIKFERPISHELVFSIDFLSLNNRKIEDQELLYLLTKEGIGKEAREQYYERTQHFNRYVLGAILLDEKIINTIKRYLRKMAAGVRVENTEIVELLKNEVIKRDVISDDNFDKMVSKLKRINRKEKSKTKPKSHPNKISEL